MELTRGQVVEYLENQKFICASVIEKKGARYRLINHNGREVNLSPARFLHIAPSQSPLIEEKEALVSFLKERNKVREQLSKNIDIKEIWDAVHEDADVCDTSDLAGLAFGLEPDADHEAAFLRAVIDDHIYFKYRNGAINVLAPNVVEKLIAQREKELEQLKLLQEGLIWVKKVWGKAQKETETPQDQNIIAYWINAIRDYCIHSDESQYYIHVRNLFRAAGINSGNVPFETMVKAGIWTKDENLEILKYGIETVFSDDCVKQSEELAAKLPEFDKEKREDLRHLEAFTIDGPSSRDLDDAITFRNKDSYYELGVHITDIGMEIKPDTALFKDAVSRATSLYLPDMQVSMLPESLSHNAWSLLPEKDRRTLSFIASVDREGNIVNSRIVRSIINVKKRLSYSDADRETGQGGFLNELHNFCFTFMKKRIAAGALPLPIPEADISVGGDGSVDIRLSSQGPSRFLVSECMIMANQLAARFLHDNDIPALYRSQPEPRKRVISGDETDLLANYRQRRLLSKGHLGPEAEPHSGLGLSIYTTITSPLRRGLDLLMQQQITSFLMSGIPVHNLKDISRYAAILKEGLATAGAVRSGTVRYWLLKYFESVKIYPLKAWILETGPGKPLVVLADTLTTHEMNVPKGFQIKSGQEIFVKVSKVNARENSLGFEWYISV